jgi:hypothetical protein
MAVSAPAILWNQMIAEKPLGISDLAQLLALDRYTRDRPLRQATLVMPPIPP